MKILNIAALLVTIFTVETFAGPNSETKCDDCGQIIRKRPDCCNKCGEIMPHPYDLSRDCANGGKCESKEEPKSEAIKNWSDYVKNKAFRCIKCEKDIPLHECEKGGYCRMESLIDVVQRELQNPEAYNRCKTCKQKKHTPRKNLQYTCDRCGKIMPHPYDDQRICIDKSPCSTTKEITWNKRKLWAEYAAKGKWTCYKCNKEYDLTTCEKGGFCREPSMIDGFTAQDNKFEDFRNIFKEEKSEQD